MKGYRFTKICIHCQQEYIGTKVAKYCPSCAKEFSKTKYAVTYKRHVPIVPHFRE